MKQCKNLKEGKPLANYGFIKYYQRLEHHQWNPPMSRELHKALRADPNAEGLDFYETYKENVEGTPVSVIRDMLEIRSDREPISLPRTLSLYDK